MTESLSGLRVPRESFSRPTTPVARGQRALRGLYDSATTSGARPVASTQPIRMSTKPTPIPQVSVLAEDADAEHGRDDGIDVRDHGRPHRADLSDQREEDEERDRGADHGEPDHRGKITCRKAVEPAS